MPMRHLESGQAARQHVQLEGEEVVANNDVGVEEVQARQEAAQERSLAALDIDRGVRGAPGRHAVPEVKGQDTITGVRQD